MSSNLEQQRNNVLASQTGYAPLDLGGPFSTSRYGCAGYCGCRGHCGPDRSHPVEPVVALNSPN